MLSQEWLNFHLDMPGLLQKCLGLTPGVKAAKQTQGPVWMLRHFVCAELQSAADGLLPEAPYVSLHNCSHC